MPIAPPTTKPPVVQPGSGNNILINPCQRSNPMLECIRNVGKEFGDIVPDFQVGRTTGVLYLSLKYHRLHPEYIHTRIEKLGRAYNLRILLLMCDISQHQDPIRELTKMCMINNITVMVAWTHDEAGLYLSTYKQFEHRPPDLIKERVDNDFTSRFRNALTSISKVNKTDVETLRTSIGSFAAIAQCPADTLSALPGFGQVKVRRIKDAFERPFRNGATSAVPSLPSQSQHSAEESGIETAETSKAGPRARALQALKSKGKGKEKENSGAASTSSRPARSPSPVWDIELDLNESDDPADGPPPESTAPVGGTARPSKRPASPVWDIELDLNSDEDEDVERGKKGKRRKEAAE
ncbi:hypothetical protein PLICRDRAFT_37060 [Plicaturopsis crispa FD-325 SS-3]|nr:hypothetical protein PLICRDRAFT_37060 [Plicaturopsis crispa FD-325 SS-3]